MIDTDPNRESVKYKELNVAELINWGYETSGDLGEAMRVYVEMTRAEGYELLWTQNHKDAVLEAFNLEFGEDDGREFPEFVQE